MNHQQRYQRNELMRIISMFLIILTASVALYLYLGYLSSKSSLKQLEGLKTGTMRKAALERH